MKCIFGAFALLCLPAIALAQDKATLDTRQLLAETVTTAKPRAEYLTGARDKQPTFVRVRARYLQLTAPIVPDAATSVPARKAVGINVAGVAWYSFRQPFTNLLWGSYWSVNWAKMPADQLTPLGYPNAYQPGVEYRRLMGPPTGGVWAQTSVACTWAGSGTVNFAGGGLNIVKGDHKMSFDLASWNGVVVNQWVSVRDVNAADPMRDLECHDAKVSSGNEFSKEILESSKKYQVLRFMDWNHTNESPVRSWATRTDPRSLEQPEAAIENQLRLANLAGADFWFNHSWNDDASYIEGAARYVHDNLPKGRKVYVEYSNEVWNWQFGQAQANLVEATALKINANNGYGAWQNYARRSADVMKVWERVFADRPGDLVRVLGTQVAYPEVTRQALKWPGILDHIDAIAGAPYFSHDRNKPYTDALLRANIADTVQTLKVTCDIARAAKPGVLCYTYEGGQHELPTDLFPLDQYEKLQRSQLMGDLYGEYLTAMSKVADLTMLYYDVGQISKFGAWGQREYGGQADAPKQVAVDAYLKR